MRYRCDRNHIGGTSRILEVLLRVGRSALNNSRFYSSFTRPEARSYTAPTTSSFFAVTL
jgi:hypothetical protein